MTDPAPPEKDPLITPRRLLLSLLLAGAAVGIYWSFSKTESHEGPRYFDSAIEAVHPAAGSLDLRQARVGIDLQAGYTAVLIIDGREIPEDQLERVESLGQVFYTPGQGKATGALEPGRHCAVAELWRVTQPRTTSRRYSWCFNVH